MFNSSPQPLKIRSRLVSPNPVFFKPMPSVSTGPIFRSEKRVVARFSEEEISTLLTSVVTKNEETLFEKINFYLFNNKALPPYSQNIIFPNLESIKDFNFKELQLTTIAAIGILAFAETNPTFAQSSHGKTNIENAQKIIDIIDPITYLSHRNSPNKAANPTTKFSDYDIDLLTLNIHREAAGEPTEGKLAVMLTVLERMKSPKYPGTVPGVVLKAYQYSWANKLKELEQELPKKFQKEFDSIKKTIKGLATLNLDKSINAIKMILETVLAEQLKGNPLPDGLVSYHRFEMMKNESYRSKASNKTIKIIKEIEAIYKASLHKSEPHPEILLIGNHLFYTQKLLDSLTR